MAHHERLCFAEAAEVPLDAIDLHSMILGRPSISTLRSYDAIFFGGSGAYSVNDDVPWIRDSIEVLLEVAALKVPAFASCFGFQGLAIALGGSVVNDESRVEMGSTLVELTEAGKADPLFGSLPPSIWVQEGHHDHVEILPEGVDLLVSGSVCHDQAFRVKGAPFWATQFHPELTLAKTIERFHHYADFYLKPEEVEPRLKQLLGGKESPEVGNLLARIIRGDF